MKAEFISTDDKRWMSLLQEAEHDFYHVPEYVKLEAEQLGRKPIAFYAEHDGRCFLIPLLLSGMPLNLKATDDCYDVTTPYGNPCPILHPSGDEELLSQFLKKFKELGAERGIATAFLRLHPLLPLPVKPLQGYGQLVRHGQTVYFELSASEEEAMAAMCSNHRRDIKKLINTGYEVKIDEWSHYSDFINVYRCTMKRLGADEMYYFNGDYFARLREAMGDRMHLGTVVSPQGDVTAGGIFIVTSGLMQYHLGGSADNYYHRSPIKLLIHGLRRWAKERGDKYLHMGGGLGGREDSLFQFKAGFSPKRADFFTYRMIINPTKHQSLVAQWHQSGGQLYDREDFFPIYRQKIVA